MALKALQVKSNYIEISWKDNNNQELHRNYTIGVTDDVCEIFNTWNLYQYYNITYIVLTIAFTKLLFKSLSTINI